MTYKFGLVLKLSNDEKENEELNKKLDKIGKKIINANCLDVLPTFGNEEFDLILTDPPYKVGLYEPGKDQFSSNPRYERWCVQLLREMKRVAKCVVFTPGRDNLKMWLELEEPQEIMVWVLRNGMTRNHIGGYLHWEPILVYKKPKKRVFSDVFIAPISNQPNIFEFPAPKPLKLFEELILAFTDESDKVLDPFLGSGTTLIACKKKGRDGVGIEINPEYCKIVEKRLHTTNASLTLTKAWV